MSGGDETEVVLKTVLLDIDEVLFPFAHAYDRWLLRNAGYRLDELHLSNYDIPAAAGPRHNEFVVQFLSDTSVIRGEALLSGAEPVLQELAANYRLIACTSRHGFDEGEATRAWLAAQVPLVQDVIFTRNKRGEPAQSKASVAQDLKAVMLIDDTAEHLIDLPSVCRGVLLKRPAGLPSGVGAVHWSKVL